MLTVACLAPTLAQVPSPDRAPETSERTGPWLGLVLPPPPGEEPAVIVGGRPPRPVVLPPGEAAAPDLSGAAIRLDLETIVGFSKESRARREIGSGQLWGRVSGFPSSAKTVAWAVEQFRGAGIADTRLQPIAQDAKSTFWLPLAWEARLMGDPSFGPGSEDVILHSAMPAAPSEIPSGAIAAPLVFVGTGGPAVISRMDVAGKIAVQLTVPQGHMLFERGAVTAQARQLFKRGAVAVLNVVRLPGNELGRDFSNCGGPCFNVGGRDGFFLEQLAARAAETGLGDRLRARLALKTETRTGLSAQNGVGVVPGLSSDETIVVNAHADAWFDGAGDNADGLAVMLALARHFAKPEHRLARTLVFVASAGHHSPGINGPRSFVAANPDLAGRAVLMLNIEHVAQRNFSPARSVAADGYRQAIADSGEAPIYAGVSNASPFLNHLFQEGVARYGTNFVSETSDMESGETGGYGSLKVARLTVMQAPPLYHTTGEVLDVISTPGLERMARFLAYFLREIASAPRGRINP
jgi:hypothetical protein